MRNFDLRELQMCELDVLKEFIRICDKHHLKYYLAWGTLLGAVRHQGFIPWDDDIDVCMPWKDYVKFKEIVKSDLNENYFYEDWFNHHDYFLYWAKLRKNNTTCMTRRESKLDIHWGVGIDIFPLFQMDTEQIPLKKKIALSILELVVSRSYVSYGSNETSKKIKKAIYKLLPKSMDAGIIKKSYSILNNAKTDAENLSDLSDAFKRKIFKQADFGEGIKLDFEGIQANCPQNYHQYLLQMYGENYMEIPQVQDRVDHGDIIVDLNKNYTEYK